MNDPSLTSDSRVPSDDVAQVSGEIVREQTVRAAVPEPSVTVEGTVRAPIPTAPPVLPEVEPVPAGPGTEPSTVAGWTPPTSTLASEGTVKTPLPVAPPGARPGRSRVPTAPALPPVQEHTVRAPIPTEPPQSFGGGEAGPSSLDGIAVPRSKVPTAPGEQATPSRRRSSTLRASELPVVDPAALESFVEDFENEAGMELEAGPELELEAELEFDAELEPALEVEAELEPEPVLEVDAELEFEPVLEVDAELEVEPGAGPSSRRPSTLRTGQVPDVGRADPAAVAGEVLVEPTDSVPLEDGVVAVVRPSGTMEIPTLAAPTTRRKQTDPGRLARGYAEPTGPQPILQAETTGPHPAMRHGLMASGNTILWIVAGALVLLAMAVVAFVLTR